MEIDIGFLSTYLLNPSNRIYWLFLLISVFVSIVYLYFYPRQKRLILNKKLWLHKSCILDYKYFLVIFLIKLFLITPIIFSVNIVSSEVNYFLMDNFGIHRVYGFSNLQIMLSLSFSVFVFSDLTRYLLHRFMHKNKYLWKIHKVHHSAKVLNPLTFYRIHPLESLLFGLRYSLSYGVIIGIFSYFFGANISIFQIMGVFSIGFIFNIALNNLRHSHIKIGYPKFLERIFISPKQHQIHHDRANNNKNYGGNLAIWDYIFNSLQFSKNIKNMHFGLNELEHKKFNTILNLLTIK